MFNKKNKAIKEKTLKAKAPKEKTIKTQPAKGKDAKKITLKPTVKNTSKKESTKTVKTEKVKNTDKKIASKTQQKIKLPDFIHTESVIGAVAILAMKSKFHKHLFVSDYEWFIIPPIAQKQFMLFRNNNNEPVAFVSWASVSDEVEKRLLSGITKLQPKDWKSGNNLYIIDIISPYNIGKNILQQLQDSKFKNQEIKLLRPKKTGNGIESKPLTQVIKELKDINKK